MIIYVDSNHKCHATNDGTMTEHDVPFFDGKCAMFIEGYCFEEIDGVSKIYPFIDIRILMAYQAQYEADTAELEQAKADLADADEALAELGAEY